jgi:hypothetical protein
LAIVITLPDVFAPLHGVVQPDFVLHLSFGPAQLGILDRTDVGFGLVALLAIVLEVGGGPFLDIFIVSSKDVGLVLGRSRSGRATFAFEGR